MIDQGELFDIPNPCQGICESNSRGYCKGCLRSREERFHWHQLTPFQQQTIVNNCEKRRRRILASKNQAQALDELHEEQMDFFAEPTEQQDLF